MDRFYTFSEPVAHSYTPEALAGMSDAELAEEINRLPDWDGDLMADLIWRAFPDYDGPWEVGDELCYQAAESLGLEI